MKGIIVKGVGGRFVVNSEGKSFFCSAKGLFRKKNLVP
ncbi:ribosome biogenesis GTPase RsgA, partial [Bacillus licheniformis]